MKSLPLVYIKLYYWRAYERDLPNKVAYTESASEYEIISISVDDFIIALSQTIKRMVIDHFHIVGDIYDRGPPRTAYYGHDPQLPPRRHTMG